MIRRRIAKHLRAHDWFATILDLLIVVLGVFIGLQVSNWNEERVHRQAARSYVDRVREELHLNEVGLLVRIAYYGEVKDHALAALAAFDKPKETLGESFLIDAFQATQILSRSINRSVYDELLSVGAMNWIPEVEIRTRIANFYQNVAAIDEILQYVPPYRENLRRLMPYAVQEAITGACDDINSLDAQGVPKTSLPEHCEPKLAQDIVKASIAEILTRDMKLDLVRRIVDIDTKVKNYQRLIDRGHTLDKFLAEKKF